MIVQSSTYDKNFLVELYEVFIIFSELQERLLTTQVIQVSQTEIFLQMHTGRKNIVWLTVLKAFDRSSSTKTACPRGLS